MIATNTKQRHQQERIYRLTLTFIFVFNCLKCASGADLTLRNDFIEQFKNKTTIAVNFTAIKSHDHAKPASEDGDIHAAGFAPEVELTTVAEIMNAKNHQAGIDAFVGSMNSGDPIDIVGVWRIWFEHGKSEVQGEALEPITSTGAHHVFEIHPVTEVEGTKILESLIPVDGYDAHAAATAFPSYRKKTCRLTFNNDTTTITSPKAVYNYVEFMAELIEDEQFVVDDGRFVMAQIRDLNGNKLVKKKCRLVFVKDSEPEKVVKNLTKGAAMHVLGIPRINLAVVSWRVRESATRPEVLTWNLPYEMIIVGIY